MILKAILLKLWHCMIMAFPMSIVALVITPLKALIETQTDYLTILMVAIVIDLFIGVIKYIKLRRFSFKKLIVGLMLKISVAYGAIVLLILLSSLEDGGVVEWFLLIGKFTVLLYPAGSAFANMYTITDGKFPPIKLMKFLEGFEQLLYFIKYFDNSVFL